MQVITFLIQLSLKTLQEWCLPAPLFWVARSRKAFPAMSRFILLTNLSNPSLKPSVVQTISKSSSFELETEFI